MSFERNLENTESDANGASVKCPYDALWRRREKVEYAPDGTATTNRYIYRNWLILAITDDSDNVLETFTQGADFSGRIGASAGGVGGNIASTSSHGRKCHHFDWSGNVIESTTSGQNRSDTFIYDPFGQEISWPKDTTIRPRFGSKEFDAQTQLVYYGYRYYMPCAGRWISRDPVGEYDAPSLYLFLENSPYMFFDANGLLSETISFDFPEYHSKFPSANAAIPDVFAEVELSYDCHNSPQIARKRFECVNCSGSRTVAKIGISYSVGMSLVNVAISNSSREVGECYYDEERGECVKDIVYSGDIEATVKVTLQVNYLFWGYPLYVQSKSGNVSGTQDFTVDITCPCN